MTSRLQATLAARGLVGTRMPAFRPLTWAVATLRTWRERAKQRTALAALDDRLLDDVGLTRSQARAEIGKPFWRR